MRNCGKWICVFLWASLALPAFAGGYDAPLAVRAHVPRASHPISAPCLQATVYPGSLKKNIERIAAQFGWTQVVWNVPNDYQWVGQTNIRADKLPGLFTKLLKNYPVQAVFYKGNHILAISPRTLR